MKAQALFSADEQRALVRADDVEQMFRSGLDTAEIARRQWRREADVLRELNQLRSRRLGLPSPYRGGVA